MDISEITEKFGEPSFTYSDDGDSGAIYAFSIDGVEISFSCLEGETHTHSANISHGELPAE